MKVEKHKILRILKENFHHERFKSEIQEQAIEELLKGERDVYVSMPTGSGKSLCFQLPGIIIKNKVTIVFSPLLALIKDQVDYLNNLKVNAISLNSKTPSSDRKKILDDLKSIKPSIKFLYITPEQAATETFKALFRSMLKHNKISLIAIDEAHCVSEWGHDFRPDYMKLGNLRNECLSVPWVALTATAPKQVKNDIFKSLSLKSPVAEFKVPCFRKNLYYDVAFRDTIDNDFVHLKDFIDEVFSKTKTNSSDKSGIIYCRTRALAESIANTLTKLGIETAAYHGGLNSKSRCQIQDDWMSGKYAVISATISFGMGVDKSSVRFVVHWGIPQNMASYYQESGRAGRDGYPSFCRLYYSKSDVKSITFLLQAERNKAKNDKEKLIAERAQSNFEIMINYCETLQCRHKMLADYFGDPPPWCKNQCDVCEHPGKVSKQMELHHKLSYKSVFVYEDDMDCSDLYEGGKPALAKEREDYMQSEKSTSDREKAVKKETTLLIQKEFALRKAVSAAKLLEKRTSAKLTKVKSAQFTSTKVNGLTNSVREHFLTSIAESLKDNADESEERIKLIDFDFEDYENLATEIEYECFSKSKAISLYRRGIMQKITEIKKCTSEGNLFLPISSYVQKPKKNYGGSSKELTSKLETVSKILSKKLDETKSRKKMLFSKEPNKQTTIDSFFNQGKSKKSQSESSKDKMEPSEPLEIAIVDVEDKESFEQETNTQNLDKDVVVCEKSQSNVESPTLDIKIEQENPKCSNDNVPDKNEDLLQSTTSQKSIAKRKQQPETSQSDQQSPDIDIKIEKNSKHLKNAVSGENDDLQKITSKRKQPSSTTSASNKTYDQQNVPKKPKLEETRNKIDEKKREHLDTNKAKTEIANSVVEALMPYYKSKIKSRELFKNIARKVTNKLHTEDYDAKRVNDFVKETFEKFSVINSLNDLNLD